MAQKHSLQANSFPVQCLHVELLYPICGDYGDSSFRLMKHTFITEREASYKVTIILYAIRNSAAKVESFQLVILLQSLQQVQALRADLNPFPENVLDSGLRLA
jgi:hypothetical protein